MASGENQGEREEGRAREGGSWKASRLAEVYHYHRINQLHVNGTILSDEKRKNKATYETKSLWKHEASKQEVNYHYYRVC